MALAGAWRFFETDHARQIASGRQIASRRRPSTMARQSLLAGKARESLDQAAPRTSKSIGVSFPRAG